MEVLDGSDWTDFFGAHSTAGCGGNCCATAAKSAEIKRAASLRVASLLHTRPLARRQTSKQLLLV